MSGSAPGRAQGEGSMSVTFKDVVIYFSTDEWRLLTEDQKQLYWEILQETYQCLLLIGCPITSPEVFAWVEYNESLNTRISSRFLEDPPPNALPLDEHQSQMNADRFPEQGDPLESIDEGPPHLSKIEVHPEQPYMPATEEGSVPNSGGQLQTVSMERASGDARAEDVPLPCCTWMGFLPTPVPPVAPGNYAELLPPRTTIPPQHNSAMGTEHPMKEMRFAEATCVANYGDVRWQAVAPSLSWSARNMQDTQPPPLELPTQEEKRYFCGWCKEPFKLQFNLGVHYKYCRQKQKQQPRLLLQALKAPLGQGMSGSRSTGESAAPLLLPQKPAPLLPSDDGKGAFLHFRPWQPPPPLRAIKSKDISEASRSTAETPRSSTATTCAMKKFCRCLQCGEKFLYKWQLSCHLLYCKKNTDEEKQLPPKPQDATAQGPTDGAETPEAPVALDVRPSTSADKSLCQCEKCGKNFSKCYISTHRAFHKGQRYKCLWCWKIFNFRSGAVKHKKYHYVNDEGINCPKCGKRAGDKDCFCMIKKIMVAPDSDSGGELEGPK